MIEMMKVKMMKGADKPGGGERKGKRITAGNLNPQKAPATPVGESGNAAPPMSDIKCIPGTGPFSKRTGYGTEGV